jgi:hypothetical protein
VIYQNPRSSEPLIYQPFNVITVRLYINMASTPGANAEINNTTESSLS